MKTIRLPLSVSGFCFAMKILQFHFFFIFLQICFECLRFLSAPRVCVCVWTLTLRASETHTHAQGAQVCRFECCCILVGEEKFYVTLPDSMI